MPDKIRFSELLTIHVNEIIKRQFAGQVVQNDTLTVLRNTLRTAIAEVFSRSKHELSVEAVNWVANQYFRLVEINGVKVDDIVVINDYKLADMSTHDIKLMNDLFNETQMSKQLNEEYRRRTLS